MITTDIAVVGAGTAGLLSALALVRTGRTVTLIDGGALAGRTDARASFLAQSSLRMLDRLDVGLPSAQPVRAILAAEAKPGRPIRPGSLQFEGELGAVVENNVLHTALLSALATSGVDVLEHTPVTDCETGLAHAKLMAGQALVAAKLVVAADGRESVLRRTACIGTDRHDFRQDAVTFTVSHTQPHDGVAYQVFFPGGPLAVLPLSGQRSSIVWTDTSPAADALLSLSEDQLCAELQARLGDGLGAFSLDGPRIRYPLQQIIADTLIADRLALVGDAAHVIHPLAGQGINLGFRDAAALAEVVEEAAALGRDIGGPALGDYARWRRGDIAGMALATAGLGHAYALSGPLGALRRSVTGAIDASPLKGWLASEAAGERPNLPALMA